MADPIDYFPADVSDVDPEADQADALAAELSGDGVTVSSIEITAEPVDPAIDPEVPEQAGPPISLSNYYDSPDAVGPPVQLSDYYSSPDAVGPPVSLADPANLAAAQTAAATSRAQKQNVISAQRKQVNNGDWRVRLRLAPQAGYLYRAANPGILQPLAATDGVIFPYTPSISTAYKANYSQSDLTHSNYRGYFYGSSAVDPVNISAVFTAQDTSEANYLLAVIHFFRSATKMFYGQDAERGSPPPLVYLSGLGEYQFNEHPCVISTFNYTLPADVDYIRAGSPGNLGVDLTTRRDRQNTSTGGIFGSVNRLASAFLSKGAINSNPLSPQVLQLNNPTYVPTKMEISLTLLPVQSRNQVSKQFSVKEFANGNLLRGGFW